LQDQILVPRSDLYQCVSSREQEAKVVCQLGFILLGTTPWVAFAFIPKVT
jgi:hypothetical protein